jgi:hypothetical protein
MRWRGIKVWVAFKPGKNRQWAGHTLFKAMIFTKIGFHEEMIVCGYGILVALQWVISAQPFVSLV